MYRNGFNLEELVHLGDWQKVQDSFAEVIGITLRTFDQNKNPITMTSGSSRLCTEVLPKTANQAGFCSFCSIPHRLEEENPLKEIAEVKCPLGMNAFIIPIKAFGNRTIAYTVAGPAILSKRKEPDEYAKEAKKIDIDKDALYDALVEINVFSYNKMRSVLSLLSDMFCHMARTGYHKKRLGEISQEITEMDPLFSSIYEEKLLAALLNTCTLALDADSGSVMTVDKKTSHLHIKAASRLDNSIVESRDLKMGESIAGLAAATAEPIILPKDSKKNGISKKMKRKYIKSSMIVPFNRANEFEVYGVINLNIIRKKKQFSEKDIALVKELINLTSVALLPVK